MNSKIILRAENIVIKNGRRSKKLFLEEIKNEEHVYIEIFESRY